LPPTSPYLTNYELGDLVIVLRSIEYHGQVAESGEVGLVVKVYSRKLLGRDIYDCRIKLKCGEELDVWFGEIYKLEPD
jgi:hypothetical protein